jgi:hypothetical protein
MAEKRAAGKIFDAFNTRARGCEKRPFAEENYFAVQPWPEKIMRTT